MRDTMMGVEFHRRTIRPWKFVIRAGIFLLLGAIVNIAVAWGLSLRGWSPYIEHDVVVDEEMVNCWRRYAPPGFEDVPTGGTEFQRFGERSLTLVVYHDPAMMWDEEVTIDSYGWPAATLQLTTQTDIKARTSQTRGGYVFSGWPLALAKSRTIPLQPIWPGFPLNSVFYGVVLWLLLRAALEIRVRGRIRRGLCPACAYPVGASPVCTECGKPVRARSVEPASS